MRVKPLLALLALPAAALAETPIQNSRLETNVLSRIHDSNQLQISVAETAKSNSVNANVRAYADRLIRDHQQADRMVMEFARREGIELTEPVPESSVDAARMKEDRVAIGRLQMESGPDFDREYMKMMDKAHWSLAETLALYQARLPVRSPLRVLVGKLAPIFEQHQRIASHLADDPNRTTG